MSDQDDLDGYEGDGVGAADVQHVAAAADHSVVQPPRRGVEVMGDFDGQGARSRQAVQVARGQTRVAKGVQAGLRVRFED